MALNGFKNSVFRIEVENASIPWLKLFTQEKYKELSDVPTNIRNDLFELSILIEKALIEFYNPDKINIASFGNYVPQVHIHVMARFKEDAFFPEPMWGKQQREEKSFTQELDTFLLLLSKKLEGFETF